jgi:hypothetical protein
VKILTLFLTVGIAALGPVRSRQAGNSTTPLQDRPELEDSGRGYAYTGDWEPERMPDMKGFVDGCHKFGIKVVLWYAVPADDGRHSRIELVPRPRPRQ